MEQRISFITLGVADLARAKAFYDALGWQAARYGEGQGIVFYQLPTMVFAIFPRHELAAETGVEDKGAGGFSGVTISHNARTREEVDAILAEAGRAGARITKPAGDMSWGGYVGYFTDPDGHVWEACFNPHADLGPNGELRIP